MKPIIFQDESVRAILDGAKTQARRIIQKAHDKHSGEWAGAVLPTRESGWIAWWPGTQQYKRFVCPLGASGDRLWVRETFVLESNVEDEKPPFNDGRPIQQTGDERDGFGWLQAHYRATDPAPELSCDRHDGPCCHWKSPILMPRWASRLALEITEVRVQRLQEITEQDARAEGFEPRPAGYGDRGHVIITYRTGFVRSWDRINSKKHPWESNPWIWVLTFKAILNP